MDILDGGMLLGDINGTVIGGVSLTKGFKGNGIDLDGNGAVHFKQRDGCYANLEHCTQGMTFATWVIVYQDDGYATLFDSGGTIKACVGHAVVMIMRRNVTRIVIKSTDSYLRLEFPFSRSLLGQWTHFAYTWRKENSSIHAFINGCDVGKENTLHRTTRTNAITDNCTVTFGTRSTKNQDIIMKDTIRAKVDETKFWYQVLPPEEIWKLYLHQL